MSEHIIETEVLAGTPFVPVGGTGKLREEIVRCRDCKHGHEVIWPQSWNLPADWLDCHGELVETWDYYNDEEMMNPVEPDGFCAWGERK